MAVSQAQRLRRAAQKTSKRKVVVAEKRKAEQAYAKGSDIRQIAAAAEGPVHGSTVTKELFTSGMGWLVLARPLPSGTLVASFFPIDSWCLGVKDAFFMTLSPSEFTERLSMIEASGQEGVAIEPANARRLLHDAVAYAADLGFDAGEGYKTAEMLFGDTPLSAESFTFGKDGEPFYMPGPHDSPSLTRRVFDTLQKRAEEKKAVSLQP